MTAGRFFRLTDLEPLECPMDLGLQPDLRVQALADDGRRAMDRRLAGLDCAQPKGDDLRLVLLEWFGDLAGSARAHGCAELVASRLSVNQPARRDAMCAWMDGRWSTRPSLIELCWRLEQDPVVTTAAVLLYDRGGGTEEQRPYTG